MRRDYLFHARPLFSDDALILTRSENPMVALAARELDGKAVLTTFGYTYGDAFEGNKKIKRIEVIGDVNVLRSLKAGKADLAIVYRRILSHLLRGKGRDLNGEFKVLGQLPSNSLYLSFSRNWPGSAEIVTKFNAAHTRLVRTKAVEAIEKRWE